MKNVAFLFSGQGAQSVGMGKELYDYSEIVRETIDTASQALGEEITTLSFEENDKINWTPYTQPLMLAWSRAFEQLLKEKGIVPNAVAGLSLGEYSALVSANVLSFEEAIQLVHKRGKYMDAAYPKGAGAMGAVLGAERSVIEDVCKEVSQTSYVAPANYNMPGQIVIGGEQEGVALASEKLLEQGAKRVVSMDVSGPFHTKLLEPAALQLKEELKNISFNEPEVPVYGNTLAKKYSSKEEIKELLPRQVMEPVYFEDMVKEMINDGIDTFVEVGPGRVLSRFTKKIDKSVRSLNVNDLKSLEKTLKELTNEE